MAIRKFLVGVADVTGFDESDNILFTSKTLLNSAMEVTLGSSQVRGGRGNQLLYTYYHTGEMSVTLEETQWNLAMLGATVGSEIVTGNNVYVKETITLTTSGAGTVLGTPLAIQGTTIYGWVEQLDGTIQKVTFSGSTFASSTGASGDVVCVTYFAADAASRSVTIPANFIPKICRLVMSAQLNSSDVSTNKVGELQIIIPKFSLSGAFTLSLASDGVSNTPLSGTAYAFSNTSTAACTNEPVYAEVIEIIDNANWYDGVTALAISGGDFALTAATSPKTLVVYAIRVGDAPFVAPVADLDFVSGTVGTCTAGLHTGVITFVAAGSSLITVSITAVPTIEASATCTAT
jgi:hypothetical protein